MFIDICFLHNLVYCKRAEIILSWLLYSSCWNITLYLMNRSVSSVLLSLFVSQSAVQNAFNFFNLSHLSKRHLGFLSAIFCSHVMWNSFPFSLDAYCICMFTLQYSLCLHHITFPVRQQQQQQQQWLVDECVYLPHSSDWCPRWCTSTHAHTAHVKLHKHGASEGSGKVKHSDEVQSKNTSCFPGKAATRKVPVCSPTT